MVACEPFEPIFGGPDQSRIWSETYFDTKTSESDRVMFKRTQRAITLLEVLVVISIISLLLAILVPSVMAAREMARRTACLKNLQEVVLACNTHYSNKGYYPRDENAYSSFVFLLPFLEQSNLFNSMNLSKHRSFALDSANVNYTSFSTKVATFICPSDVASNTNLGRISYAGNYGVGPGQNGRPNNGPFASWLKGPEIKDSTIRDGLSNTVAVSEFIQTDLAGTRMIAGSVFQLNPYNIDKFDTMINDCTNAATLQSEIWIGMRGSCWAFTGFGQTSYDHNITPNGNACATRGGVSGAWTASSKHPNGVNCAYLDGHINFVKNSIATETWRALGTMNGGEVSSSD